jgi:hypothetical protein
MITLSPEQIGLLIGLIAALVGGIIRWQDTRNKASLAKSETNVSAAEAERLEAETSSYLSRRITDTWAEANAENRALQVALRECAIIRVSSASLIKELRALNTQLVEGHSLLSTQHVEDLKVIENLEELITYLDKTNDDLNLLIARYRGYDGDIQPPLNQKDNP